MKRGGVPRQAGRGLSEFVKKRWKVRAKEGHFEALIRIVASLLRVSDWGRSRSLFSRP